MGSIIEGLIGGLFDSVKGLVTGFVDGIIMLGTDILSFMQPVVDWLANISLDQKIILVVSLWLFWNALLKEVVSGIVKRAMNVVFWIPDTLAGMFNDWVREGQKIRMQNRNEKRKERRKKRREKYQALQAKRKAEKKAKKEERAKYKNAEVTTSDKLLRKIFKAKKVYAYGGSGAGKTLLSSMLIWFILAICGLEDKKTARKEELRGIDGRTAQIQRLADAGHCAIYSDADVELEGLKSRKLEPIITQQEQSDTERPIYFMDDITIYFPKHMHTLPKTDKIKALEDSADRHRHYDDSWWVYNGLTLDSYYVGLRNKDEVAIHVLDNWKAINDIGGAKLRRYNFILNCFPAWFTGNGRQSFQEQRNRWGMVKQFFLNFAPLRVAQELLYYDKQDAYYAKIKEKYNRFNVLFEVFGKQYVKQFTEQQKIQIQSRHLKVEYRKKFDKEGKRINVGKVNRLAYQ